MFPIGGTDMTKILIVEDDKIAWLEKIIWRVMDMKPCC